MTYVDPRYGWMWDFQSNMPIDELSEVEAQARDGRGQLYCVELGAEDLVESRRVLEVNWEQGYLGVWFFDSVGRQSTKYAFDRVSVTKLFLSEVVVYSYSDDKYAEPPESESSTSIYFTQDGRLTEVTSSKEGAYSEVVEFDNINVESNYETLPTFGDWRSVVRYDR
ncbi:hypothetical protein ACFWU5_26245 [Nocardia sp. NPDC058640]|uniref:hypothetical protein n=1 Tax=Nocardia sp. NPDC058640 TaxID=3346571 RepID=UPI0036531061